MAKASLVVRVAKYNQKFFLMKLSSLLESTKTFIKCFWIVVRSTTFLSFRVNLKMNIFEEVLLYAHFWTLLLNYGYSTTFMYSKPIYPPAGKVSRKVTNLTWRKSPHTPVYGVKEFVCLSVCFEY